MAGWRTMSTCVWVRARARAPAAQCAAGNTRALMLGYARPPACSAAAALQGAARGAGAVRDPHPPAAHAHDGHGSGVLLLTRADGAAQADARRQVIHQALNIRNE